MAKTYSEFTSSIQSDWIDYNEHLNDAAYAAVLTRANEAFLEHVNLSQGYREKTNCSMYTVEMLIGYQAEVHLSETLSAQTTVSELGAKKIRVETKLFRSDGVLAATGRVLYLHYDGNSEKVTPFSESQISILESFKSESDSTI